MKLKSKMKLKGSNVEILLKKKNVRCLICGIGMKKKNGL